MWDARRRCLWWTDLAGGRLFAAADDGCLLHTQRLGDVLGAVVLRDGDELTAALDGSVAAIDAGGVHRLADLRLDDEQFRVNDAACDPAGRLWVSVVGRDPDRVPGRVLMFDGDEVHERLDGLQFPNGFAWSPDGSRLYLAESDAQRIRQFTFDVESGRLGPGASFVQLDSQDGLPDGVAVDEEHGVWVAVWGSGEVRRYSSEGALTATVTCPVTQVTSCAFGEDDRRTLFITSAREGLTSAELSAQPDAGSVFSARVPWKGLSPSQHERVTRAGAGRAGR